jgi:hypothetical protein
MAANFFVRHAVLNSVNNTAYRRAFLGGVLGNSVCILGIGGNGFGYPKDRWALEAPGGYCGYK